MKKITLLLFAFSFAIVKGQVETETIDFENNTSETNNDFVNNFKYSESTNEPFVNQVNIGGLVVVPNGVAFFGGALELSNSVNFEEDSFIYRSNYKNNLGEVLETSIDFSYNPELIENDTDQRAIAIWLRGETGSSDIGFYINDDQTLSIKSAEYDESIQLSLDVDTDETNNYYRLVVKYQSIGGDSGDEIFVSAEVFDIGLNDLDGVNSGTTLVGSHTATINDLNLINSSEFAVHLSASKDGGSEFLDNFTFKGVKGSSNFDTLGVANYNEKLSEVMVYPNPTSDWLTIQSDGEIEGVEIIDLTGRVVLNTKELNIDISKLINGNYIVKTNFSNGKTSEKRILKID